MIGKIDPIIAKKISSAKTVSKYAVIYRYPDVEKKALTFAAAKVALKKAQKIYDLLVADV